MHTFFISRINLFLSFAHLSVFLLQTPTNNSNNLDSKPFQRTKHQKSFPFCSTSPLLQPVFLFNRRWATASINLLSFFNPKSHKKSRVHSEVAVAKKSTHPYVSASFAFSHSPIAILLFFNF